MASERVKPDVHRWIDGSALYDRSTILRVIDEEIDRLEWVCSSPEWHMWDSAEDGIRLLQSLRARFEEADDE